MAVEEVIKHVARHHNGLAVLSATINGTTVYFSAEGGEPVHTFLSQIAQGDCANQLQVVPGVVNATWSPFVNAATEIGMNVKYAFSSLTDPACIASMTAKCFVAFNAVAPCVVKGVLQTGVELTKAAATSAEVRAAFMGVGATLCGVALTAGGVFFWKKYRRSGYQSLDDSPAVDQSRRQVLDL